MSVYRPKDKAGLQRSQFFYYDFVVSGVRFHGSTGETEERKAKAAERTLKEQAKAEISAAKHTDRTEILSVFGRFWQEVGQHDRTAETTLIRMERLRSELLPLLSQRGRPPVIGEITDDVLASYVARRRGQTTHLGRLPAPATINREIQVLRRIMRRAALVWRMQIVLPNWGALLHSEPDERVVYISPAEEQAILSHLRDDFRPAIRFLALSGLRARSVLPLPPAAVDLDQGIITIRIKSKHPGGRVQVLPITRAMRAILVKEMSYGHDESVFTFLAQMSRYGHTRGKRAPLSYAALYHAFKAAAAAIGRPDLRIHDLRHTAATRTLRATKNLRAVQHQLGHTRISTTTRYAHLLIDDLREAMEQTHGNPDIDQPASDNAG